MNHTLAKELKDAGFPQDGRGTFLVSPEHPYPQSPTPDGSNWNDAHQRYKDALVIAPTLEELIEACEKVNPNMSIYNGHRVDSDIPWFANAHKGLSGHDLNGAGNTPIEAVARLWLALNKKQE